MSSKISLTAPLIILFHLDCVSWWTYGDERYLDLAIGGAGTWAVLGSKVGLDSLDLRNQSVN